MKTTFFTKFNFIPRILSSKKEGKVFEGVLHNTKFLQLKQTKSPSGTPWVYSHRTNTVPKTDNAVVIAPIIHNEHGDTLVLLETRRPPMYAEQKAKTCIEFPAGLVADEKEGETAEQAIAKELLEEVGYKADVITINAQNVGSSPGLTSETSTLAIAEISNDKIIKEPITDNGIIEKIHKIPFKDICPWLKSQELEGKSVAGSVYANLFFIFKKMLEMKGK
ncbi:MAG: NUDIX hydrolase [Candidatus Gastranaerophilaceae bacterium]